MNDKGQKKSRSHRKPADTQISTTPSRVGQFVNDTVNNLDDGAGMRIRIPQNLPEEQKSLHLNPAKKMTEE
jgi:hypothetical protein